MTRVTAVWAPEKCYSPGDLGEVVELSVLNGLIQEKLKGVDPGRPQNSKRRKAKLYVPKYG